MKNPFYTVGTALLLGFSIPAGAAVTVAERAEEKATSTREAGGSLGQELLRVTNDMWFLLSGVADRKAAESSAARFLSLVKEAESIGNRLYDSEGQGQDLEALDMLHYRIAESLEDLNTEFTSLCRARCYGSEKLIEAFHAAVSAGLFDEELLLELTMPKPPLSERETRQEIVRLKRLIEPDRALLALLREVKDVKSAEKCVERLLKLAERMNALLPDQSLANRDFAPSAERIAREVYTPISPLLWGIRSEIVRIAALPGYEDASYDAFSDALDAVYSVLGDTHSEWFDDVFDASFRTDLDDALHENATTSK